jgi:hypothetical protein
MSSVVGTRSAVRLISLFITLVWSASNAAIACEALIGARDDCREPTAAQKAVRLRISRELAA